jgi:hypothetical protein
MAALSKGSHIETAERIARGLPPIHDEDPPASPVIPATEPEKVLQEISSKTEDENESSPLQKTPKVISSKKTRLDQTEPNAADDTSDRLTVRQSNGHTVAQSDRQTVRQFDRQTVRPLDGHTV